MPWGVVVMWCFLIKIEFNIAKWMQEKVRATSSCTAAEDYFIWSPFIAELTTGPHCVSFSRGGEVLDDVTATCLSEWVINHQGAHSGRRGRGRSDWNERGRGARPINLRDWHARSEDLPPRRILHQPKSGRRHKHANRDTHSGTSHRQNRTVTHRRACAGLKTCTWHGKVHRKRLRHMQANCCNLTDPPMIIISPSNCSLRKCQGWKNIPRYRLDDNNLSVDGFTAITHTQTHKHTSLYVSSTVWP